MKLISLKSEEIKDRIAKEVGFLIANEGFSYKKTNNWFIKTKGDIENIFQMLFHTRTDHYAIEIFLYIRHKKVEKILRRIIGDSTNITLGNTLGVIFNSPDGREVVHNNMEILLIENADIEAACESISFFFQGIARTYFEQFENLEAIDDIVNNAPFDYTPANVGGTFGDRCMRGLVINRLLKKENFIDLIAIYNDEIKGTLNEQIIAEYEKVRDFLMYNKI